MNAYSLTGKLLIYLSTLLFCVMVSAQTPPWNHGRLQVSENGRYLSFKDGTPFFWLGDTGWCLGMNLNREEAEHYLDVRKEQGFNVIQMMLMWRNPMVNTYGRMFKVEPETMDPLDGKGEYGYWDHIDYIVELAAKRGMFLAMLPTWGLVVNNGVFDTNTAAAYAKFLALRYREKPNVIWVNGGDVDASIKLPIWNAIGETIRQYDPNHLITFHPRGRRISATWFHHSDWLDLNMFQSGHMRYGQTRSKGGPYTGNYQEEDGWRFVEHALGLAPAKPVLDGEPAYEDIPQGLHDGSEPRWTDADARRSAYWAVFAGACGHTYGNNAVWQMYKPGHRPYYFNKRNWYDAIHDRGAQQMKYLKELILRFSFFDRVPDQGIVAGAIGERYDRIVSTRGKDYIMAYTYTGSDLNLDLRKISGETKNICWMKPSSGEYTPVGTVTNGTHTFFPPGRYRVGNDWVLIAVDAASAYKLD